MPETRMSQRLNCPRCGETILPDDKFCFHCGLRLARTQPPAPEPAGSFAARQRFPQWPLAVVGLLSLVLAGYIVHRQSALIARLTRSTPAQVSKTVPHVHRTASNSVVLHPVVTTTIYPANLPPVQGWTAVAETYQNVQFGLRLPLALKSALNASPTAWTWGSPGTPYQVALDVVTGKPSSASTSLGPNTWGTPIRKTSTTASQALYINWAAHKWVEVSMVVPVSHIGWLASIASSVRVS